MNIKDREFTHNINTRVSEELFEEFAGRCEFLGVDKSSVVRSLLNSWLKEQNKSFVVKIRQNQNSVAA